MPISDEIRAVAVDYAGTLSTRERRRPNGNLVRRVLADFDVPTDEEFATTFDTAMWRYYVESLADSIPRLLHNLATAYGIELPNMTMLERAIWDVCGDHPVDDAGARAVRAQHEAGRVTLLASNTVRPAMYRRATLADAGLEFMKLVCSSDIGVAKPDAGFYERLIEEARVPAENLLFVGDNALNDVARPRQAGMQAAWVQKKRPAGEPPVRLPDGTWVLSSLSQLTQILS
jgi:FMN phosphatase YigB (HAD superfamily)